MPISRAQYIEMLTRLQRGKSAIESLIQFVDRESDLHNDICDECRRRGWIALHGSMARPTARTEGEPDFVILADGGRVLLVECKSKSGKLSPAQAALAAQANKLGHTIHVVRSLEEFLKLC